ncbi:hypothetical protein BYT27DRAFT_7258840 [Phlegmacium glaucopus]|nr:hypothetical protein BYT27DRAFT_7258840 [Phlegmacium glaucopus]
MRLLNLKSFEMLITQPAGICQQYVVRYDEPSSATPLRPRVIPLQPLPVAPQHQLFPNNINPNVGKGSGVNSTLQAQLSPITSPSDDPNIASPSSRYALICEKMFRPQWAC